MLTRAHVFSGVLCSLAGALYSAAILFYDTQFRFLLTVMPWLLSAICCVALDLLVSFHCAVCEHLHVLDTNCFFQRKNPSFIEEGAAAEAIATMSEQRRKEYHLKKSKDHQKKTITSPHNLISGKSSAETKNI